MVKRLAQAPFPVAVLSSVLSSPAKVGAPADRFRRMDRLLTCAVISFLDVHSLGQTARIDRFFRQVVHFLGSLSKRDSSASFYNPFREWIIYHFPVSHRSFFDEVKTNKMGVLDLMPLCSPLERQVEGLYGNELDREPLEIRLNRLRRRIFHGFPRLCAFYLEDQGLGSAKDPTVQMRGLRAMSAAPGAKRGIIAFLASGPSDLCREPSTVISLAELRILSSKLQALPEAERELDCFNTLKAKPVEIAPSVEHFTNWQLY